MVAGGGGRPPAPGSTLPVGTDSNGESAGRGVDNSEAGARSWPPAPEATLPTDTDSAEASAGRGVDNPDAGGRGWPSAPESTLPADTDREGAAAGSGVDNSGRVVEQLFRHSAGRITATLVRVLGPAHLDLAEEAVQEAMVRALQRWPFAGVPDNPSGWLFTVARNHVLGSVRHGAVVRAALPLLATPEVVDDEPREDDELALMFLCCHPELPQVSQVA